jgi:NAD(P)H-quinone oxidoreductase subunit 5
MLTLILLIAAIIFAFSRNYMRGDRKYWQFFQKMVILVISLVFLVISDNLLMFFAFWCISNLCLTFLMIHKKQWVQARNSGILALKNFALGAVFLGVALGILYFKTGEILISQINLSQNIGVFPLILLVLAAMSQSALIPFHKWLISSLNSPTPVSALMHAGLVNGGGFLLVRFAPILLQNKTLLLAIFVIGVFSAIIATLWKLMKNDVKGMLACSTVAQMGFMVAQCGLGLFASAIAHLCWHGLFKAYLFLSFPNVVRDNRIDDSADFSAKTLLFSLFCATFAAIFFAYASDKDLSSFNTNYVLVAIAFIASAQLSLNLLKLGVAKFAFAALFLAIFGGWLYGMSIKIIANLIEPLSINQAQNLSFIHYFSVFLMFLLWLLMIFRKKLRQKSYFKGFYEKFYVKNLNLSQADEKTITTYRNFYKF